jgi:hypothetical protein
VQLTNRKGFTASWGDHVEATMPQPSVPSPEQRAALLRFEALYEQWRVTTLNLLHAEQEALAESLRTRDGAVPAELAARVARLRAVAGDIHRQAATARAEAGE